MFRTIVCFLAIFLIFTVSGCGPKGKGLKVEYVDGTVTMDGEPVAEASVIFVPATDTPPMETATGMTNEKGVFTLTSPNGNPQAGAVAGEYKVLISKIIAKSLTEGKEYGTSTGYAVPYTQTHLLPAVYRDPKNTPLTATVKKGKNKGMDFELKSEP